MSKDLKKWAGIASAVIVLGGGATWFVRADDSHSQGAENTADLEIIKQDLARKVAEEKTLERACEVGQLDPSLCYIRGYPHPEIDED